MGKERKIMMKIIYCQDCGKQLSKCAFYVGTKRCKSCAITINNFKRVLTQETKNKISQTIIKKGSSKGSNNGNFRDGHTMKKHFCKCGKQISYDAKRKLELFQKLYFSQKIKILQKDELQDMGVLR
jgi:hypothetical protein